MRNKIAKLFLAGALALGVATAAKADVRGLADTDIPDLNQAPAIYKVEEVKKHERTFRQQPPMVPHQVEKYQLDVKVNECLKCHDWKTAAKEKAPEMAESHYKDRDGNQYDAVYGGRWFCNTCHAPMTDAKPLIDNTFESSR